ncbi:MAG TPA: hypothetical protein P5121_39535, partial [Caldilineaceae bacterium]|nr:hypothetical protein [Caldilineaceae bacterium]
ERLHFMGGYGVMVAYLHDIGMRDFSPFGRTMHPEAAAQLVFLPEFDELVEMIWEMNCSNVAWRLLQMDCQNYLPQPPRLVLRELLALAACHSKSKVPVAQLNDPMQLRRTMQQSVGTDLHYLYHQQSVDKLLWQQRAAQQIGDSHQVAVITQKLRAAQQSRQVYLDQQSNADGIHRELARFYQDFAHDSFLWLITAEPVVQDLVLDVVDTLRCLRAADALRQRGTVLKTSAAHEIMVDHQSANAVYALRSHNDTKLFFIEAQDPISAGEANLAGSELDRDGNLRIAFQRGMFASEEAVCWAAHCGARIINDIQADVIESFQRTGLDARQLGAPQKSEAEIEILVEGVDDNPQFAGLICQELARLNPAIATRSRPLPSLQNVDPVELTRYLNGKVVDWSAEERCHLLQQVFGKNDEQVQQMELTQAFLDTRIITLQTGETLIEAGSRAGFVFIPLGEGLQVSPLGGYTAVRNPAYVSIGNTGVIRGALRNATVTAEAPVDVLVIPKQVYLDHWYRTYPPDAIPRLFRS